MSVNLQLPQIVKPNELNEPAPVVSSEGGYTATMLKFARRAIVFMLGISVLAVGIVMIVGPGPAVVVIPLGLAILATEFLWARKILDSLKRRLVDAKTATAQAELPRWLRFLRKKNGGV